MEQLTKEEKIKIVVSILLEHEDELSDGYRYYAGIPMWNNRLEAEESMNKFLCDIAEEILEKINGT